MRSGRAVAAAMFLGLTTLLSGAAAAGAAEKDVAKIPSCQYCGMDRGRYGSTRMLIEYENGSVIGTCSIHCAAVDLAQSIVKQIKSLEVADYHSRQLVDAGKAIWVVGAGIPGVMAAKSRVAFAGIADAEAFRRDKGGEIVNFDSAIISTYCDMWPDTQAIRWKRSKQEAR